MPVTRSKERTSLAVSVEACSLQPKSWEVTVSVILSCGMERGTYSGRWPQVVGGIIHKQHTGELVVQAAFCLVCNYWVPLHPERREEMWQQHVHPNRSHTRGVAARLAEDARLDSTSHNRSARNPQNCP